MILIIFHVRDIAIMSKYLINNYPNIMVFKEKILPGTELSGEPIKPKQKSICYKSIGVDGVN